MFLMSREIHEQHLWQAVLWRAAQDVISTRSPEDRDFQKVASWVGTYPSRDFRAVCSMAGLEPDFVHPRLRDLITQKVTAITAQLDQPNPAE